MELGLDFGVDGLSRWSGVELDIIASVTKEYMLFSSPKHSYVPFFACCIAIIVWNSIGRFHICVFRLNVQKNTGKKNDKKAKS